MCNFNYYYKYSSSNIEDILAHRSWDHFVSSFTSADRVLKLYDIVKARNKTWLVFNEYGYSIADFPHNAFSCDSFDEAEFVHKAVSHLKLDNTNSICIDSTGFIRPYLAFFILYLFHKGYKKIDILYTEPKTYSKRDQTQFCLTSDLVVRQVRGFEGSHASDTSDDVLLVNSGYDSDLIVRIAENKKHAKKIQLFGFPSLRPDMFQENILRAYRAHESIDISLTNENLTLLAPANDPFATAQIISEKINNFKFISNLYISPLATKAQLIGIVLYYILGSKPCPTSIIFPFSKCYSKETSQGTARTWLYTLEF